MGICCSKEEISNENGNLNHRITLNAIRIDEDGIVDDKANASNKNTSNTNAVPVQTSNNVVIEKPSSEKMKTDLSSEKMKTVNKKKVVINEKNCLFTGTLYKDGTPFNGILEISGTPEILPDPNDFLPIVIPAVPPMTYIGDFKAGLFHGEGKLYYDNGSLQYKGYWSMGLKSNEGHEYYRKKDDEDEKITIDHEWKQVYNKVDERFNEPLDEGDDTFNLKYVGEWKDGYYSGKGRLYTEPEEGVGDNTWKGRLLYDGQWENGNRKGQGKAYMCSNAGFSFDHDLLYDGQWDNDKQNGKGKQYCYGNITFDGTWKDGEFYDGQALEYDCGENSSSKVVVYKISYKGGLKQSL